MVKKKTEHGRRSGKAQKLREQFRSDPATGIVARAKGVTINLEREASALVSLLSLVGVDVTRETVRGWQEIQREEVRLWASAVHMKAGDHEDVEVPRRPSFLPPRTTSGE